MTTQATDTNPPPDGATAQDGPGSLVRIIAGLADTRPPPTRPRRTRPEHTRPPDPNTPAHPTRGAPDEKP